MSHLLEVRGGENVQGRKKLVTLALGVGLLGAAPAQATSSHDWWNMVHNCEAKGVPGNQWYANTGNTFYFGPQFTKKTWHSEGGGPVREMGDMNGRPMRSYSVGYIIRIAENTMRDQGPTAWPHCYGYL